MSFGGFVQGMVTSQKNNRALIRKRKKYFDLEGDTPYLKKRTNFKKATPAQLREIREKIKKENRKILYINHIFIRIFIFLLCYVINLIF